MRYLMRHLFLVVHFFFIKRLETVMSSLPSVPYQHFMAVSCCLCHDNVRSVRGRWKGVLLLISVKMHSSGTHAMLSLFQETMPSVCFFP